MVYVWPHNQYHAYAHRVCTLTLAPDIAQWKRNIETESEQKETAPGV